MIGRDVSPFAAVEVRLAHVQWVLICGIGDLFDNAFSRHHPLRAAKTTKSRVGDCVGLHRMAFKPYIRVKISVIGVKEGSVGHGAREVGRKTASRGKAAIHRFDASRRVERDIIVDYKVVAFSRSRHILVPVGTDFHGAVPLFRRHCGNSAEQVHLAFLAAEPAAHAAHVHHHCVRGHAENLSHHMLRLGGVLRGGMHDDIIVFSGNGQGDMPFEVHVVLSAHSNPALDPIAGGFQRPIYIAAFEFQRSGDVWVSRLLRLNGIKRMG